MRTTRRHAATDAVPDAFKSWIEDQLAARRLHALHYQPLRGAASYRRFTRVATETTSFIAMEAPPDRENGRQFVELARHFGRHGIPVPEVVASDLLQGFLLVTDLGDRHLHDVYGTPEEAPALAAAIETLTSIQRLPRVELVPPYTRERLADEFALCAQWLLERFLSIEPGVSVRRLLERARDALIETIAAQPTCTVHRDYHSQNLMWRENRSLGVLDFQDALWGPVCYDIASLLRDCYHRFDEPTIARWRDYYFERSQERLRSMSRDELALRLDWTAIQRQIKAVGIFARLRVRDGRDVHLRDIVPVLGQLIDVAGRYDEIAALAVWLANDVRPQTERALERLGIAP
jgi:aminoglycoside/choline kinase family phosphotransferase